MKELKCPHCGNVFTVDESDYAALLNQVKNSEFEHELSRRLHEIEQNQQAKMTAQLQTEKVQNQLQLQQLQAQIQQLQAQNQQAEQQKQLAVMEVRQKATSHPSAVLHPPHHTALPGKQEEPRHPPRVGAGQGAAGRCDGFRR